MKPSRTQVDSVLRWIAIAGLVACATWMAVRLISDGHAPRLYDGYRYRNTPPADWAYPTEAVATSIALFALEVLAASLLLRRARRLAGACFLLALLCGVVGFFAGILAMHAPRPYGLHVVLLFLAGAWMLAMSLVSGVVALVMRERGAAEPGLPAASPTPRSPLPPQP